MKQKSTEPVLTTATYQEVDRALILVRPQVRKQFDESKIKELRDSIQQSGIAQPLLLRPMPKYLLHEPDLHLKTWRIVSEEPSEPGVFIVAEEFPEADETKARLRWHQLNEFHFELVCGERRFRASDMLEMNLLPCMIRVLTDAEVLNIQLVENAQREGLTAIEEAEAFGRMRDELGYSVDRIIKETGKKRSTVYNALALLKLSLKVREAVITQQVPQTIANLIAMIPGEKNQLEALHKICHGGEGYQDGETWKQGMMSFRRALSWIREEYTTDLTEAEFDIERADYTKLGAAAPLPACGVCPLRSGNCLDEHPEIKNPNVCTDAACFKLKGKLHEAMLIAQAETDGHRVLVGKEAQAAFDYGGKANTRAGFMDRDVCWPGMTKPIGDLLKSKMPVAVMAIVDGKAKPIFETASVEAALKEKGLKPKPMVQQATRGNYAEEEAKREAKRKKTEAVAKEALPLLLDAAAQSLTSLEVFRILAHGRSQYSYCRRYDVEEAELDKRIDRMTEKEIRLFLYESEKLHDLTDWEGDIETDFAEECKKYGINLKAVANELKLPDEPAPAKAGKLATGKTKARLQEAVVAVAGPELAAAAEFEEVTPVEGVTPKKRGMTAIARARLAAVAKARWAKLKDSKEKK